MNSLQQVNPTVRRIRPRTSLHHMAARITEEISQGAKKPFQKVIDVSVGDPHRAGMAPISFVRQVLAASLYSELLQEKSLPLDARQRAQELLGACEGGSVGSYSVTPWGLPHVQRRIAEFIMKRDGGVSSSPEHIICSHKALSIVLHLLASGEGKTRTGVLTPAPCPHTLPPLLDEAEVTLVPYQLMEERGWAVDLDQLHKALRAAKGRCNPRAIYISNPGNPTGHVQDRKSIEGVIKFAAAERLLLLVDEVYQDSVYGQQTEFISYKRVLFEMGTEFSETVELVSFHSLSSACMADGPEPMAADIWAKAGFILDMTKSVSGLTTERHKTIHALIHSYGCGLRGAYMEVINMDPAVFTYLKNTLATASPPVPSLCALEVMVHPPTPGDPSYETYSQNAQRACEFLNLLPGMNCRPGMGGVFLYPRLTLPFEMIEQARVLGVQADELYCQSLLEEEGVCLGAGSENGQDANYHLRLCVLVLTATLEEVLTRLCSFHLRLLDRHP